MHNINNINIGAIQNLNNNNFLTIANIKSSLEEAKNSLSNTFFLKNSLQQKKDNIQKILDFLESNDNCINNLSDNAGRLCQIFNQIHLIKSPENLQNQDLLVKLNHLIQEYLGTHRIKQPFRYFYHITNTSTVSLQAYNRHYKKVILQKLKDSIKVDGNSGKIINIGEFNQLYIKYKDFLGNNICKQLFIELLNNCSSMATPCKLSNMINLLKISKKLLSKKSHKFYKAKVLEVFKEITDYKTLKFFLSNYGNFINDNAENIIINKYQNTDCIKIAYVISEYIIDAELYINLPPRLINYNGHQYKLGNDQIYAISQLMNNGNYNKRIKSDIEYILNSMQISPPYFVIS